MLEESGLKNTQLNIRQNSTDIKSEILSEISKFDNNISEKDIAISKLREELDTYKVSDSTLSKEISILFPKINEISYGKIEKYPQTDSARLQFVVLYSGQDVNDNQLKNWLQKRLNEKDVQLVKKQKQ